MHARHAAPPAPKRPAPTDLHLTNDQRQGRWHTPNPQLGVATRRRVPSEKVNIPYGTPRVRYLDEPA